MVLVKFRAFLIIECGLGDITVEGYLKTTKKFIKDTKQIFPNKQTVLEYILSFHNLHRSYSHIRNFSKGMEWYMLFWQTPITLAKQKKPERIIREVLTEDEVKLILKTCKNTWERTIIATLAYSGIRARELCRLTVSDVDFINRTLLVRNGKGAKDRIVFVSQEYLNLLKGYIKESEKEYNDRLFTKDGGILRRIVKRVAKRAKVSKRVYPHLFRHSLATNLLIKGCDLLSIQKQLGHRHIQTTLIYLQFTNEIHHKKYDTFCPKYLN